MTRASSRWFGAPSVESEPRRFSPQGLALIDEVAAGIEPDDSELREWFSDYRQEHRCRLAADLHLIEQHLEPGSRVLEYGAIPLLMTAALSTRGYAVSAVDLDPERFAAAIDDLGLDVRRCNVETEPAPFADDAFDGVVFNELFEHLRINPIFTMGEVYRVLKPAGLLLLSTPNLRSFRGLRNLILRHEGHAVSGGVYRQYEKLDALGHMGHVKEYTPREVSDFLSRIGFRVEKIIYRGGHGRGLVGLAERVAPTMRPFFALIARKGS